MIQHIEIEIGSQKIEVTYDLDHGQMGDGYLIPDDPVERRIISIFWKDKDVTALLEGLPDIEELIINKIEEYE